MEKLDKPLTKNYRPLILWAGDLAELLSEIQNCINIELIADDVKFESIEEFISESKGRRPAQVYIRARDLTINLSPLWASLYVSSSQLSSAGLFYKIDTILSRCERKPKFLYRYFWAWFLAITVPNIFRSTLFASISLFIWSSCLAYCWAFYVSFIIYRRYSMIWPFHKEERPSFFQRNFDNIIIALISASLGGVVGVAATKFVDRIWPNAQSNSVTIEKPQVGTPK